MTIGKQKCKICNKLYRCKLQSTPHVHAEINGVKIIATIHEDDSLLKFLHKLDSFPYEPSLKSLKGECDGELCEVRSYYDLTKSSNRKPTKSTHSGEDRYPKVSKNRSCKSWFRKRIGKKKKPSTSTSSEKSTSSTEKLCTPQSSLEKLCTPEKKPAEIKSQKVSRQKNQSLQSLPGKKKAMNKSEQFSFKKKETSNPKKYQSEGEDSGNKKHEMLKKRRKARKKIGRLFPTKSRSKQYLYLEQITKRPLLTLPVLVNLKHLFNGNKYAIKEDTKASFEQLLNPFKPCKLNNGLLKIWKYSQKHSISLKVWCREYYKIVKKMGNFL
ncbi:uncharacterized protein isoform X2 [Rhodnius prolixus]|uniref:uncharacterized protein isoform X2 n=1 Tax=Rhodnius prolixus TaxID=13249 RepID=UPI003D18C3BD